MTNQPTSPKPTWQPGHKITSPLSSTFTALTPSELPVNDVYRILINTIVPRPIAFVSTQSKDGLINLAPYSFFNAVSSNPAALMISIAIKPDGSHKDTLNNIEETGEFVVNSANRWLIEALVYCAGNFPSGTNEMELVGLTPLASEIVKPPRVKEAAAHYECTVYEKLRIGDGSAGSCVMVVGKIERIHLSESLYREGKVDTEKLEPIGRLGGISYTELGNCFEIAVPKI